MTANTNVIYPQFEWDGLTRREQLLKMDEYYSNNSLYETTRLIRYYQSVWNENIKPLRTPVHRSVEFFVGKIAIGEPAVSARNETVADNVRKVLEWSNFQVAKPAQIRQMSKYGDLFRKVLSENGKVWHEAIDTNHVVAFKEEARGFLTEIRIDVPIMEDGIQKTQTEFWTMDATVPYMAVWIHRLPDGTPIEQIARNVNPIQYAPLRDFGIDFLPFTRSAFQKDGEGWGKNCVEHALIKVDEANRQATRLHQMLYRYNKPLWAVSPNQVLSDGSPIPAPKLKQGTNSDLTNGEIRDDTIIYLPGNSTIESLVPKVDYAAALDILLSQEKELEKDLPELLYFALPERADLSGKALRTLLGAAVDRANQAQSNYIESLVRANQMALTIGTFQGIFPAMGNFDDGSLAHSIRFEDPFPVDPSEKAATLQTFVNAGMPLALAMKFAGFSEEEIALVPSVSSPSQ